MKQHQIFGTGSLRKTHSLLHSLGAKRIFLVTGGKSFKSCGASDVLNKELNNYQVTTFDNFEVNPKLKDIKEGVIRFKKAKPDVVIAVGGGSVIDTAKAINALSANHGNPADYVKGKSKINKPGKTLIAIPTTSGSGSEATHFAVVYIGTAKYSLAYKYILPQYSLIDPQLTLGLPAKITACSGMDALGQAIEAYWSVNSTPLSKRYSSAAIKLILNNLVIAVNRPSGQARIAMSKAAHLAGKAINIAKTTACHSISYPLTSFFGIPHGHAVGLTLSSLLEYNAAITKDDVTDRRGVSYVRKVINNLGLTPKTIDKLMKTIGLETRLSQLGITKQNDLNIILDHGFNPDRVKNNPRLLTREALSKILANLK